MPVMSNQQSVNCPCITGVSGQFLGNADIEQFTKQLLSGVDQVNQWLTNPQQSVQNSNCDLEFIGIDCKDLNKLDEKSKNLAACIYDAIFDSGTNPAALVNTKTGVFIGTACNVVEHHQKDNEVLQLATDMAKVFKFKGPQVVMENEDCSALFKLASAVQAINSGECNQAVVCGIDSLKPKVQVAQESQNSIACVFIQKKSDCKRSYASILNSTVLKQKMVNNKWDQVEESDQASQLKDLYSKANIEPSRVTLIENYGCQGNTSQQVNQLMKVFGDDVNRSLPLHVRTVKEDLPVLSGMNALVRMIVAVQRGVVSASEVRPVSIMLQGRVKSVVKCDEKLCDGLIAINACGKDKQGVHLVCQPDTLDRVAKQGDSCIWNKSKQLEKSPRLFVCDSRTQQGAEAILNKVKQNPNDLGAQCLLESICCQETSPLTSSLNAKPTHRAFTILNTQTNFQQIKEQQQTQKTVTKPIYCVFSGINTNWQDQCKDLMQLPVFAASINKSDEILRSENYQLLALLNQQNAPTKNVSTLNSFVAIAALQIALVDCLTCMGVKASGLIGHSIGELACAYADGALSQCEAILCAFQRGKCIENARQPDGSMASVKMSWAEAIKKCPAECTVASNDHEESVLVSGAQQDVQKLITKLKEEGIQAEEIVSTQVALHSRFMTAIAPSMKQALDQVIKNPGKRSCRWISTSIPEKRWQSEIAERASSGYMVNNICTHVLFKEALELVPADAVVIQIGPSEFLKDLLHKSLPNCVHIPLMGNEAKRGVNSLVNCLEQIGCMWINGCDVNPMKLMVPSCMDKSVFPVPVNTGFLSDLAKLTYLKEINTTTQTHTRTRRSIPDSQQQNTQIFFHQYTIDLNNPEDQFLLDHKINGQCVLPVSAVVYMVWSCYAQMNNSSIEHQPLQLSNIELHEEIKLRHSIPVQLTVNIKSDNKFEIIKDSTKCVCSGMIQEMKGMSGLSYQMGQMKCGNMMNQEDVWQKGQMKCGNMMNQKEVYQKLKQCGHDLTGDFRLIVSASEDGSCGEIAWTWGKWIALLDSMFQMNILAHHFKMVKMQISGMKIKSITIDPHKMKTCIQHQSHESVEYDPDQQQQLHDESFEVVSYEGLTKQQSGCMDNKCVLLPVNHNLLTNTIVCGGVQICEPICGSCEMDGRKDLAQQQWNVKRQLKKDKSHAEVLKFVPYIQDTLSTQLDQQGQEINQKLTNYLSLCKKLCEIIANQISKVQPMQKPSQVIQETECYKDGTLIQLLCQAVRISVSNSRNCVNSLRDLFMNNCALFKAVQQDNYINQLPYDYHLEMLLDTVVENIDASKIKVLEITSSFNKFYGMKLSKVMEKCYPEKEVEYTVVTLLENQNEEDILTYLNQCLSFPVEKVDWKLLQSGRLNLNVPSSLRDYDLVLLNTSLHGILSCGNNLGKNETRNWVQVVSEKIMKPRGFMMMHEFTRNWENMQALTKLEQMLQVNQLNVRKGNAKFISEAQCLQLLDTINLIPVSVKTDFCLSTLILCRNECSLAPEIPQDIKFLTSITFLDIDKQHWQSTCEHLLSKPEIKRCILVSTQKPQVTLIHQIKLLKCSNVNGWKIRCVFASDNMPIKSESLLATIGEQEQIGASEVPMNNQLMEQVLKADLFMNVFNQGEWGSLHSDENLQRNEQTMHQRVKYLMPRKCVEKLNRIDMRGADQHEIPIVIIHPIEGHGNMLRNLANMLKFPVYCVQFTTEATSCQDIQQLAEFYWTQVKNEIGSVHVHLCGLGFGALVALEMVSQETRKCASLTLLDGGCVDVKQIYQNLNRKKVETECLTTFLMKYLPTVNTRFEVMGALMKCQTLEKRIEFVVNELMDHPQLQFDLVDITEAAYAYVMKSLMKELYMPPMHLRQSHVLLIKADNRMTNLMEILEKCCSGYETHVINCDQRSLLEGDNCVNVAGIMNENLVRFA